jgi:hypothetical protein
LKPAEAGRSDAPAQTAKTTLFAAGKRSVVSKKSSGDDFFQ